MPKNCLDLYVNILYISRQVSAGTIIIIIFYVVLLFLHQCKSNSQANDGNKSGAPRTGKRKGSTALNEKPSSNSYSQAKASSTGKRKASTALNEKPHSGQKLTV
jgi:hypothetical protein